MIRPVRNVAVATFALFAALFINLNVIQVIRADELANDSRNTRGLIEEYAVDRGSILARDGETELATSTDTGGRLRYLREYPQGELYVNYTGYASLVYGRSGIESAFNDHLTGAAAEQVARGLVDLVTGRERAGDDVVTTVDPVAQEAARDALGGRRGAVVALQPQTGEILAMFSSPTFDPEPLSSHSPEQIRAFAAELDERSPDPRLNRPLREWYPPGSTFKVVTAAGALEDGLATPSTTFPDPQRQELPQTSATIGNFGGGRCAGGDQVTLERAMEVSCNTTFAILGLELGSEGLVTAAERFGLNTEWNAQLTVLASQMPGDLDPPSTAQSAIGQRDVRVTPLQMAMIAGAIANDGVLMQPRVANAIVDRAGREVRRFDPEPLRAVGDGGRAVSSPTAAALRDMMVGVVADGTGGNAAISGVTVGGKTGTAQVGEGRNPTVWFIGFAPAEDPQVAVAVVIEDGGDVGSEATGGALAAPVARSVMEAVLQ